MFLTRTGDIRLPVPNIPRVPNTTAERAKFLKPAGYANDNNRQKGAARWPNASPSVARTLADLDGAEKVARVHLAEALSYRALADEVRRAT
jgi:magnesium chelatase family protein